ncbi:MAG: sterol desaturase family protein [Pseudomonadota bacterium]
MNLDSLSFLRPLFAFSGLFLFWLIGIIAPFRRSTQFQNTKRLAANLALTFGNGILVKILFPLSLIQLAGTSQWNVISIQSLPQPFGFLLSLVFLDFMIYWQHRLTHKIPILWRLHRVHHTDTEIDATSAGRFHTLEILLSFTLKAFVVVTMGLTPLAIFIFEIILNFSASFNHGNFALPKKIENGLRLLIITPDLHRIHHSAKEDETNSNYGFSISLWDRVFGSYRDQPIETPNKMLIGLNEFRTAEDQSLAALIAQPWQNPEVKPKERNHS